MSDCSLQYSHIDACMARALPVWKCILRQAHSLREARMHALCCAVSYLVVPSSARERAMGEEVEVESDWPAKGQEGEIEKTE